MAWRDWRRDGVAMTRARLRVPAFLLVLALGWLGLLAWAAGVDWTVPLAPEHVSRMYGSEFQAVFGDGASQGPALHVSAAAEDHSGLQVTRVPHLRASDHPVLRYRFSGFPRTLELALVFRTAEEPDDVRTIALPWPAGGTAAFDLSRSSAWEGTLIEIGFSEFAVAQLVPPEHGFGAFDLEEVRLESISWQGKLAALFESWSLRAPWQLISVSAIGPDGIGDSEPHAPRAPLVLAIALAIAAACARWVLGVHGRRLRRWLLVGIVLLWFALDLAWLRSLDFRRQVDRDVWGELALDERQRRVPDSDIAASAERLKTLLQGESPPPRILVDAASVYQVLRFIYLAMPLDVAPYAQALQERERSTLPIGTVLVRYGEGEGVRPVDGVQPFGIQGIAVQRLHEDGDLAVYRVVERVP